MGSFQHPIHNDDPFDPTTEELRQERIAGTKPGLIWRAANYISSYVNGPSRPETVNTRVKRYALEGNVKNGLR